MKFVVRRASKNLFSESDYPQPIEGTVQEVVEYVETEHVLLHDVTQQWLDRWHSEGRDHTRDGSEFKRIIDANVWVIEIADLEHLFEFFKEEFPIIFQYDSNYALPELLIYDGYIE